ncbi:9256_t:CDS:1, partial [Paraglomus occultum]
MSDTRTKHRFTTWFGLSRIILSIKNGRSSSRIPNSDFGMDHVINEDLEQVIFGKLRNNQGSIVSGVKRYLGTIRPESHGPDPSTEPKDSTAGLPIPELGKSWTNWAHTITFTPQAINHLLMT